MGIPCVSLSGSNPSLWDSFLTFPMSLPVVPSNLALLGLYPGCSNPPSSYLLYLSPSDSYPSYSSPSGPFLFQSRILGPLGSGWSQSKVRGSQVVIIIIVKMIRLLSIATFVVHVSSSISIVQHFGVGVWGLNLRFKFGLYLNLNLLRGLGSHTLPNLIPKSQVQNQVWIGFGRFRNRTTASQLFACDFNLQFVFCYVYQVGRVCDRCPGLRRWTASRTWNTKWVLLPGWCGLPTLESTPWGQVPSFRPYSSSLIGCTRLDIPGSRLSMTIWWMNTTVMKNVTHTLIGFLRTSECSGMLMIQL